MEGKGSEIIVYIVRHGERIDHIDKRWVHYTRTPYDPPLTDEGKRQAKLSGEWIYAQEAQETAGEDTDTKYHILSSPFLRCVQTGQSLYTGFSGLASKGNNSSNASWKMSIEPGFSEWLSPDYFPRQVPNSIIKSRYDELSEFGTKDGLAVDISDYKPAKSSLPTFPESYQAVIERFKGTFGKIVGKISTDLAEQSSSEESSKNNKRKRQVLVIVTHAVGIPALLWHTTKQWERIVAFYCSVTRTRLALDADALSVLLHAHESSKSSDDDDNIEGVDISELVWEVDFKAFDQHLIPVQPNL